MNIPPHNTLSPPTALFSCCDSYCAEEHSWPAQDLHWSESHSGWLCVNCWSEYEYTPEDEKPGISLQDWLIENGITLHQLLDREPKLQPCVTCEDVRRRLHGHPDSKLDGVNGIAAATMREVDALRKHMAKMRLHAISLWGFFHKKALTPSDVVTLSDIGDDIKTATALIDEENP